MINIFAATLIATALASGSVSGLNPTDFKAVADTPTVTLDPLKSYILVQVKGGAAPMAFIRLAEPAGVLEYKARRAAAFEKAHAKWAKAHAAWQRLMNDWPKISYQNRPAEKPREPIEPTDARLGFPTQEQENLFMIGPLDRFAKGQARSVFLEMVPPGRYAFYGAVNMLTGQGLSCLCMGSITFEVKPGEVVNIGTMRSQPAAPPATAKEQGDSGQDKDLAQLDDMPHIAWDVPTAAMVDSRLATYRVVSAVLHPSPHFANFFGLLIDRVPPIPGVLTYDRDKGVDLTTRPSGAGVGISTQ